MRYAVRAASEQELRFDGIRRSFELHQAFGQHFGRNCSKEMSWCLACSWKPFRCPDGSKAHSALHADVLKDEGLFKTAVVYLFHNGSRRGVDALVEEILNLCRQRNVTLSLCPWRWTYYPHAVLVFSAASSFGIGETMRRYYGTLVYSNLANVKQRWNQYGEKIMSVPVQTLIEWAVRIPDTMTDGNGTDQTASIVPTPFVLPVMWIMQVPCAR